MKKKMKVMFIATANNIHTVKWVNALCDEFEMHLVYCRGHGESINKIDNKVVLHELKYKAPLGYYMNAFQLKKIFKEICPNIVNVHYASGYGTLARIARIKPVILSLWGSDVYEFPRKSIINKEILKKNVRYASAIASTSNIMAEELKKQVKNIKQDIYITPFGVDTKKFMKDNSIHQNENTFNVGNIKALEEVYGIKYGILAIKNLRERLIKSGKTKEANKIRMYIYGDGTQREELNRLIEENGLNNIVFLEGKIPNDEVPEKLNKLDVFCATSNSESFGVAIVEAMACELPIVATDAEGFCEIVENLKTGYIVERRNVEQISMALEKVFSDSNSRKFMGQEGRKRVLERYDWEKNVETMKKIYKHIAVKGQEEI